MRNGTSAEITQQPEGHGCMHLALLPFEKQVSVQPLVACLTMDLGALYHPGYAPAQRDHTVSKQCCPFALSPVACHQTGPSRSGPLSSQPFNHFTTGGRTWSSPECHRSFDRNPVLRSDETKMELFGNRHSRWAWRNKKNAYTNNNVSLVEVMWCFGAVFPPKALGTLLGYMASWAPWNTRKCLFWIWLPLPGN